MRNKIKYLQKLLSFLEYHNLMAPFPVYDTEYVATIKIQLENMKDKKIDYDTLPTVACKYCDSLGIQQDEVENDICIRCGAINDINIFPSFLDYQEYIKDKDESN